mmetsp:Transcript_16281/g.30981  ORF Transcript_16281/g.30981 Transcript_16281/m.30981 type:complete len:152 (-) Transcript_16281:81-536(-)|eukprot:scaffold18208_cov182-Amphora_coffeaeformis.AAC.6
MSARQDLSHLLSYGKGRTVQETILFLLSRGTRNAMKQVQLLPVIETTPARQVHSQQPIYVNDHQLFLTFIKILFRYLAKANVPQVEMRAKLVVSKYIRMIEQLQQYNSGDNVPLREVLRSDLRHSVGEVHWLRANDYLRLLCVKKNIVLIK